MPGKKQDFIDQQLQDLNSDGVEHRGFLKCIAWAGTVSTDGVFNSKVRVADEKVSYTFDKAGTYPYYCTIHPKMAGKVVVQ